VLEPYAAPGATFHYSNTGYLLLGMIIERVTGAQVSAELRSRLLDPLGLSSTFFAIEEGLDGEVAAPWADLDSNGVLEDISYVPRTALESTGWAAGAVYSSAEDVVRFLRALIQGEVLQPSSLDQMLDFQPFSAGGGYGLGVQEIPDFVSGRSGIGHDGGTLGYSSRVICVPDEGVFVSVLLNHSSASADDDYRTIHAISSALAQTVLDR
jgi:D-alanyl-D-alanine carboxypeptidase